MKIMIFIVVTRFLTGFVLVACKRDFSYRQNEKSL
jgi:hypothetical protein